MWQESQSSFATADGVSLFYRCWLKTQADASATTSADQNAPVPGAKTVLFVHRGHEHSGRISQLLALAEAADQVFCFDHRGHGYSPGERGAAPDFSTMVRDFDDFVRHLVQKHQIDLSQTVIIANSVGAVITSTWLLDYGQRVAGVVLAAAAFAINLYVPFANAALAFWQKFDADHVVTSYIQPSMLTHDSEEINRYTNDPLITKNIYTRVLLDLAKVGARVVHNAAGIACPVLMLCAGKDYVVKAQPQRQFFNALASVDKELIVVEAAKHAILYERADLIAPALAKLKQFVARCLSNGAKPAQDYLNWDKDSQSARQFVALQSGQLGNAFSTISHRLQRWLLGTLGRTATGMQIGLSQGFDSGASLDYVYRNQASGRFGVGKLIDQGYLQAIGWRGIRLRKQQLQQQLENILLAFEPKQSVRVLDIACGGGRYTLESCKRLQDRPLQLTLRDLVASNLTAARSLAQSLELRHDIDYQQADAFAQHGRAEQFDIAIASGIYELFSDNSMVLTSLQHVARELKPGGFLIYTGQPWHPQLLQIAETLQNHVGKPWLMRPRSQLELNAMVESAGFSIVRTLIGLQSIFTVSVARKI